MTLHPSFDLDSLTNCIVLIDEHGVIDTINQAAEVLFETSAQRAIGMPFEQLAMVPGSEGIDWYETLMSVALGKLPTVNRDLRFRLRSGKEITVDVVITPLQYETDSRILLEMSPLDRVRAISETENLREAQKRLHNVVKGLAHEVKNPLGGIRGAAQLISKRFNDPKLDQYTDIIIAEVDRLQVLVDRMLGPRESLSMATHNIHEVTERVRQLLEAEAGNRLQVRRDYDPSLPEFDADRDQLTQAVLNIARNALEASPEQCRLTLKTRALRQFTLNGERHRLVCVIEVIDEGPGIPAELLSSVFLPMITSRSEGSGLGLSVSQMIVNRHGGVIQAESSPGHTCFTILLPMEPKDEN